MRIDPSAPVDKPETAQMVVIHKAFRREFALLPAVLRTVPAGDTARAQEVVAHADLMFAVLHDHHDSEDTFLWPLLQERVTLHRDLIDTMESQHQVVADLIGSIQPALTAWSSTVDPDGRDRLADQLERLHTALVEHLDLEEVEVLPLIHQHLSVAEWLAPQKAAAANGPSAFRPLMLLVGTIMEDATAPEQAWFLHEMPAPARPIWRLVGTRMYAKHVRRIRRSITPGAVV